MYILGIKYITNIKCQSDGIRFPVVALLPQDVCNDYLKIHVYSDKRSLYKEVPSQCTHACRTKNSLCTTYYTAHFNTIFDFCYKQEGLQNLWPCKLRFTIRSSHDSLCIQAVPVRETHVPFPISWKKGKSCLHFILLRQKLGQYQVSKGEDMQKRANASWSVSMMKKKCKAFFFFLQKDPRGLVINC